VVVAAPGGSLALVGGFCENSSFALGGNVLDVLRAIGS